MSREDLHAALDALAKAHGSSELASAFRSVQRAVHHKRKQDAIEFGPLQRAVNEALALRDELKAKGVSGADLDRGLEGVLRQFWPKPKGRTEPWRDLCEECRDYGLVMATCPGDATCGRPHAHAEHEYGTPCWCEKGRRFRDKPKPEPSEFTDAGKTPKKGFTRFGR